MYQDGSHRSVGGYNTSAKSGTQGSTRGRTESSRGYARSEAGRGYLPRSTGAPSSYDRNDPQYRAAHVEYPQVNLRSHSNWDEEAEVPHTSYSDRRYRGADYSLPHAMSSNGRDFHAPPSVRLNSGEDAGHTFRNETSRTSFNHPPPSYGARHSAAPSLSKARRDPSLTRQTMPSRPTASTRPIRSALHSSRASDVTHPSQRTHRPGGLLKQVRFERTVPGTRTSVSIQSLPPPAREQEDVSDVRQDIPPPVDAPVAKPRSKSSLVAIIWRAVRRLLARKHLSPTKLHPLLHGPTVARPAPLSWDVRKSPLLNQSTLAGVSGLTEPATSPPTTSMRLLVDVPGLIDAQWSMTVFPFESPSPQSQPKGNAGTRATAANAPIIRCIDVLHALHGLLQRRIKEHEYWSLEKPRRERVSRVFWDRCSPLDSKTTSGGGRGEPPNTEASFGVRRIDLLDAWGWGGLSAAGQGEWIVRFRGIGGS